MNNYHTTPIGPATLLGRVVLSGIFLMSGITKLTSWDQTAAHMEAEGMVAVPLLLVAATVVEIACGLALLVGFHARWAALMLALFLVPVTLIFHDFWTYSGQQYMNQMQHFTKNFTIFGGLLMVVGFGPGWCSWDERSRSQHAPLRHTGKAAHA